MSRIILYYHNGSGNHGCEAIVRSTKKILDRKLILATGAMDEDINYGLDEVVELFFDQKNSLKPLSYQRLYASILNRIRHDDYGYIYQSHKKFFDSVKKGDICLSIGGDNYCYKGRDILGYYNKILHKKGTKTVLWGCSFDPKDMTEEIKEDIKLYNLIIARESISYEILKSVNKNTILLPDPAFQLDVEKVSLPEGFIEGNTIGINVSPLASSCGKGNLVYENYRNLIRYIVESTDSIVALIPHVVWPYNDDRSILNELYNEFATTGRVIMANDSNCMQLKYVISKCRFFVGARTHATIAAYSTCVPTLVAGYSVKARGIARDIFGTDNNYVVPVQNLKSQDDVKNAFRWIQEHEQEIVANLNAFIPEYKKTGLVAKRYLDMLL